MGGKNSHVEERKRATAAAKKGADGHESDAKTFKNNAALSVRVLFYIHW